MRRTLRCSTSAPSGPASRTPISSSAGSTPRVFHSRPPGVLGRCPLASSRLTRVLIRGAASLGGSHNVWAQLWRRDARQFSLPSIRYSNRRGSAILECESLLGGVSNERAVSALDRPKSVMYKDGCRCPAQQCPAADWSGHRGRWVSVSR